MLTNNKKVRRYINRKKPVNISLIEYLGDRLASYSLFIMLSSDQFINNYLSLIMLNGIPCVCYLDNFNSLIKNEDNAYVITPNDKNEMIEKINLLIESIDKRKVLGKNSIRITQEYSKEIIYPMWLELFEKIEDNIIKEKNNKRK